METIVNEAIKILAGNVTKDMKSDDALKYTQAALNLAHVLQVQEAIANNRKQ